MNDNFDDTVNYTTTFYSHVNGLQMKKKEQCCNTCTQNNAILQELNCYCWLWHWCNVLS